MSHRQDDHLKLLPRCSDSASKVLNTDHVNKLKPNEETIFRKVDTDNSSDESESDNEKDYEFEFYSNFDMQDFIEHKKKSNSDQSFTNDNRIVFPNSNLTVSDVLLMLKAINIKFGSTRELQNVLLNFVRILSGPEFESWDYSPYLLFKAHAPTSDKLKKYFYCPECNVLLGETLLSATRKISLQCEKCLKIHSLSSQSYKSFHIIGCEISIRKFT